jgi:hypothetical protein
MRIRYRVWLGMWQARALVPAFAQHPVTGLCILFNDYATDARIWRGGKHRRCEFDRTPHILWPRCLLPVELGIT